MSKAANGSKGTIIKRLQGCDYFIVEVNGDYAVGEWFGGYDRDEGDELKGDFNQYGTHDFEVVNVNTSTRLWIEDYWLTKERSFEILADKCNLKGKED